MKLSPRPAVLLALLLWVATGALAQTTSTVAADSIAALPPPTSPEAVLAVSGPDTLRTNLQVAEALMGEAVQSVLPELPPPPAVVVLVPGSTEQAANVMTNVARHQFVAAGYAVQIDQAPAAAGEPVLEFRYRVENLQLAYPETGRRLLFWKSWVGRQMTLALQVSVVDENGALLVSRRQAHGYQDRVPIEFMDAVESPTYEFTRAEAASSGGSRRLEQVVVLGTLAALVAVYFANTE